MGFSRKLQGLDREAIEAIKRLRVQDKDYSSCCGIPRDHRLFDNLIAREIEYKNAGMPNAIDNEIRRMRK